ncbi:MAG TPA: EAL domain-containing protein [Terriglobales bacterium]|nr:EAL domain-containing protein [Terriglobales bacterium]
MRILSHLLMLLLSSGAAIVVVWLLPGYVPGLSPVLAVISGGFAFSFGCFLHIALSQYVLARRHRQQMSGLAEDMTSLLGNQHRLATAVDRLDVAVANLEGQPPQNVDSVVAEVKVLQSLVERLYSARAKEADTNGQAKAAPTAGAKAPPAAGAPSARAAGTASKLAGSVAAKPGNGAAPFRAPASMGLTASGKTAAQNAAAAASRAAARKAQAEAPEAENTSGSLPMPPIAEGLDEKTILDIVRDGLRENGVELALQPIVSLPQRKRRYYECFSPIRAGADRVLLPDQYIDIAERHGLITAVDNLMLFRCIQLIRRLRRGNSSAGFFLNISHHTLADRDFFQQFINLMSQHVELAPNLVFEFAQRGIESADQAVWADLGRLAQMGFRFSIDQIYSLDLDVADLSSRHVRFLKFGADTLLSAVAAGQIGEDPGALKRILDSYAIDLVADRIESETVLRELLDLHIDFGQGYLFGEPRLVRNDAAAPNS